MSIFAHAYFYAEPAPPAAVPDAIVYPWEQISRYAGMDATAAYRKVMHDANPEVDSMLGLYEIGVVRRLDFGSAWRVVISPQGLRFITLRDIYRAWISFLYSVVEMENALRHDFGVRLEPVTYDETPGNVRQSPYKTRQLLQTHQRFTQEYLVRLTGPLLEDLWAITSGAHEAHYPVHWLQGRIAAIQASQAAQQAAAGARQVTARLRQVDPAALAWCSQVTVGLEAADKWFLGEVKMALRRGLQVFERWGRETLEQGSAELVEMVQAIPGILEVYYQRAGSVRGDDYRE